MKPNHIISFVLISGLALHLPLAQARELSNVKRKKHHSSSSTEAVCHGGKATSASASAEVGRGGGLGSQSESTILAKIQANNSSAGIPEAKLKKALDYLYAHKSQFRNQKVMTLVKYNSPDIFHNVMYIIDLGSGKIEMHTVAQGKAGINSRSGSNGSEVGFMRIGETYLGKHGLSARLDGLESGNSNARSRAIVIHPANYVKDGCKAGRSWGCLALDPAVASKVIQKTKGGSLLYAF